MGKKSWRVLPFPEITDSSYPKIYELVSTSTNQEINELDVTISSSMFMYMYAYRRYYKYNVVEGIIPLFPSKFLKANHLQHLLALNITLNFTLYKQNDFIGCLFQFILFFFHCHWIRQ